MNLLCRILFCIIAMMSVVSHGVCQTGSISGTVTVAGTGEPVREGIVSILQLTGTELRGADAFIVNGSYAFDPTLPDGSYMVKISSAFNGSTPYIRAVYDTGPCSDSCLARATPVVIKNGATVSGINFQLKPGGAIRGKITSEIPMTSPPTVMALNVTTGDLYTVFGVPTFDYDYEVIGVVPGTYYIFAHNFTEGFSPKLFGDISCSMLNEFTKPPCPYNGATPIQVDTYSNIKNLNINLTRGGKIGGVVRDAKTKKPIADASVTISDSENAKVGQSIVTGTDSEGRYNFSNIFPAGDYFIKVQASSKYEYEIYDNIYCKDATCDITKGTPIKVAADQTAAVNVDLSPVSGSSQSRGKADLKGTVSASKRGKNVKITVQVQNSGTSSAEPCDVVLFFSKKSSLSSKEEPIATFSLATLKAKGRQTLTATVRTVRSKPYVIASIDYNKVVAEKNERNNLISQRIK